MNQLFSKLPKHRCCYGRRARSLSCTSILRKETRKEKRRREAAEQMLAKQRFARKGNLIEGKTGLWEVVVGIEIHAQINASKKLFSNSSTSFGVEPNTHVSLLDAAIPGSLPKLNMECVKKAVQTALALGCDVKASSVFDRKHYFYPDMPAGFQITQFREPFAVGGVLDVPLPNGSKSTVTLAHIQLEQDSGKTVQSNTVGESLVDLNRAGSALMEIVSNADIRSSEEAGLYTKTLQRLLRTVGSCSGNMDQGDLRCDVNVSVRKPGDEFGQRVEVKNVNSIKFLCSAIEFEAERQIELLESGQSVDSETRNFDSRLGETIRLRSKEETVDYRFLPEPDLPALTIDATDVQFFQDTMPLLPAQQQKALEEEFQLSAQEALILMDEPGGVEYLKRVLAIDGGLEARLVSNWIINELFGLARSAVPVQDMSTVDVTPLRFSELLRMLSNNTITSSVARRVLPHLRGSADSAPTPQSVVEQQGWQPIGRDELEQVCRSVVDSSSPATLKALQRVKSGDNRAMRYFVGQVAKQTSGRADFQQAELLLKEMLNEKIGN